MDLSEFFSNPFVVAISAALVSGLLGWRALNYRVTRLEDDLQQARTVAHQKDEQIEELEKSLRQVDSETASPVAQKSGLIATLNKVLQQSGAQRASFYVPVHNQTGEFLGLIVVATAPRDLSSESFVGTVFSGRDSKAVECFLKRETVVSHATSFSVDNFRPDSTYSDCLQTSAMTGGGERVGVVQLLSEGGSPMDQDKVREAIDTFRAKLVDLGRGFHGQNEKVLEFIDLKVPRASRRGTALAMDISNSSALFVDEARSFITRKLMSELMRVSVEEIGRHDGVFESFTGDGFMAAFSGGLPESERNSADRALGCAMALQQCFDRLIDTYRADLAHLDVRLSLRFGMSTGTIHPIMLSFGQLRTASVIGRTPSRAKRFCDMGPRGNSSINIDYATFWELTNSSRARFQEVSQAGSGKEADRLFRLLPAG